MADLTEWLWAIAFSYFPANRDATDAAPEWTTDYDPACTIMGTDEERIALLRRTKSLAAKFAPAKVTFDDLWTANAIKLGAAWPPNPGSASQFDGSSADQALFNHLAWAFGNNCEAIERIALTHPDCALRRDKWNRADYLRRTILNAVATPKTWKPRKATADPARFGPVPAPPTAAVAAAAVIAPTAADGVPPPPDKMPEPEIRFVGASHMPELFAGYVYVNDMHRIVSPDGFVMDKAKFDAHPRFAKREYMMKSDGSKATDSAWEAFIQSEVSGGRKVRGALFDPRSAPGAVLVREGQDYINTWRAPEIVMEPGDVEPFLKHLQTLFVDWRLLLNYLKFMMQRKGEKAMWWPFLQGVPGNGKSFINATMRYCIGRPPLTQSPTASNLDSQFNSMLYGCLFLAIEDIKVADDYAKVWETIKPMVTQTELEIQYKGVDKVTREVCFNAILNSNHKNGIRKEPDDRRIAPFFSRQQRASDLERDGLTEEYFTRLWGWAIGGGWSHVAHYLANDPIDAGFSHTKCPVTSSTAEHIKVSRSPAHQEIIACIETGAIGFRGGWVNMAAVARQLEQRRYRIAPALREAMVAELGYVPHPGLPGGRLLTALSDRTQPILYVLADHTSIGLTDPTQIKGLYESANRG